MKTPVEIKAVVADCRRITDSIFETVPASVYPPEQYETLRRRVLLGLLKFRLSL